MEGGSDSQVNGHYLPCHWEGVSTIGLVHFLSGMQRCSVHVYLPTEDLRGGSEVLVSEVTEWEGRS